MAREHSNGLLVLASNIVSYETVFSNIGYFTTLAFIAYGADQGVFAVVSKYKTSYRKSIGAGCRRCRSGAVSCRVVANAHSKGASG